jgi:hypothetical protein
MGSPLLTEPSPNDLPEPSAEMSQLGRAARLLEDAQRLLCGANDEADARHRELVGRIRGLETNLGEMEELLVRTERQAAQLANLYVATYQLHASLEVADVRAAIADIAVNLLGAAKFSIFVRDEAGVLRRAPEGSPRQGAGADEAYQNGDSVIDACLRQGAPQFGPLAGSNTKAAVPFVRHGDAIGVLVLESFLGHKPGLDAEDHELLDLMAAHAASALLAAQAFHVSQRKLTAYEGLLGFMRGGGS